MAYGRCYNRHVPSRSTFVWASLVAALAGGAVTACAGAGPDAPADPAPARPLSATAPVARLLTTGGAAPGGP